MCPVRVSENMELFLLSFICESTKKLILQTRREWTPFLKKGMTHKCHHDKTEQVQIFTQDDVGVVANRKIKSKIFAKRINVHTKDIKHSDS